MATWADVRSSLHTTYRVSADDGDRITLIFDFDDRRSQLVVIGFARTGVGAEFVSVESPIGKARSVNLMRLLARVGDMVVGGLSLVGDTVTLRHAVPLADMSVEEFEYPLQAICSSADELERSVSFRDDY